MRARLALAAVLATGLAGCTELVPMTPANGLAVGSPVLHYARGVPGGLMKVMMPDGEVLPGTYRVDEFVTPGPDGAGNFHASASGPRTRLVCTGNVSGGHGPAECRAQNGAVYQLQL